MQTMSNEGIDNGAFDGQDAVAAVAAGYPYTQAIPIRYARTDGTKSPWGNVELGMLNYFRMIKSSSPYFKGGVERPH